MSQALELLSELLAIPSVNPMGRNVIGPPYREARLTAFLEAWLRPLDVELRRVPVAPERDNLLATFHGGAAKRHVMMEVHQDTVPVEGMTVPPFAATVEGELVYGRGACDNKGPMTAMLLALRRLATERPRAATVTLALTVDEEFTFTGITELVESGFRADEAIVAEPTSLDVVIAHKGGARWLVETRGQACHSSVPDRGVNAVYRMGRVVAAIERYAKELPATRCDSLLGRPTISVGVIDGGTAVNIVPDRCRIEVDRRLIPGETPESAHGEFVRAIGSDPSLDFPIEFPPPWWRLPPMSDAINGPLADRFGAVLRATKPAYRRLAEPYGTNASALSAAGMPAIVFGPGDIAKAHTPDECVPLPEIESAAEVLFRFCVAAGNE